MSACFVQIAIRVLLLVVLSGGFTQAADEIPLVIYLECTDNIDQDVTLSFDKIGLVGAGDTVFVTPDIKRVNSLDISGTQIILAQTKLNRGEYDRAVFYLSDVTTKIDHAKVHPVIEEKGYPLLIDVRLSDYCQNSLSLNWQPNYRELDQTAYNLNFSVIDKPLPPIGSQILVTATGTQSLVVLDRNSYQVVKSYYIGQNPTEMVYQPAQRYVYVLITDDNVICAVDLNSMELVKKVSTNYNSQPSRLILSDDNQSLYVLNKAGNNVAVFDLASLSETRQYLTDYDPVAIGLDDVTGKLFVSSSFNEYFTVVSNHSEIGKLSIDRVVSDFIVYADDHLILAAGANDNMVTGYNSYNGSTRFRVKVCSRVENMIYNSYNRTLYASIPRCRQIAYIKPYDELEINTIELSDQPGRIATDAEFKNLYIPFPETDKIGIYNINSRRPVKIIPVAQSPHSVLVPN